MELALSWLFLVAIFKGDLQRTRNLEYVNELSGRKDVTVS
jgi:ABC-type microcin C transport system permease subunit YejE